MTKKAWFLTLFFLGYFAHSQITSSDFRSKKISIKKDTIRFDSVAINPQNFKVLSQQNQLVLPTEYKVLYTDAILIINSRKYPEITLEYFRFPSFLTRTYSLLTND